MQSPSPQAGQKNDKFLKEFIQRLDLGEFDGKLHEVLRELTRGELEKVAEYLADRT